MDSLLSIVAERVESIRSGKDAEERGLSQGLFNILIEAADVDSLVAEHYSTFTSICAQLFSSLLAAEADWDEDLIDLSINIIDSQQQSFPNVALQLHLAQVLQQRTQGRLGLPLPLINRLLVFGKDSLPDGAGQAILDMAEACLQRPLTEQQPEYYDAEALILIQLLLQCAPGIIGHNDLERVIKMARNLLGDLEERPASYKAFMADKLANIALSTIITAPRPAFALLKSNDLAP